MAAQVTVANAALAGAVAAVVKSRGVVATTSFTAIDNACRAFADKVNTTMDLAGPVVAGTTAMLLTAICEAVLSGRNISSATASDYAAEAAAVNAAYLATVGNLL